MNVTYKKKSLIARCTINECLDVGKKKKVVLVITGNAWYSGNNNDQWHLEGRFLLGVCIYISLGSHVPNLCTSTCVVQASALR